MIPYTPSNVEHFIDAFQESGNIVIDPALLAECGILKDWLLERAKEEELLKEDLFSQKCSWGRPQQVKLRNELTVRGYSPKTTKAYSGHVDRFFRYTASHSFTLDDRVIQAYSVYLLEQQHSHSYVNQSISAIKFFLEHVYGFRVSIVIYKRPKKEQKLPNVLSQNEVIRLLKAAANVKHRAILYVTYSSGLRVSEVARLRYRDLDKERKTIHVRQGKGRKDRMTVLSDTAFAVIEQYVLQEKPEIWLFPGQTAGRHLTERTVQKVFQQTLALSGISKNVTVHSLRHYVESGFMGSALHFPFVYKYFILEHSP